MKCDSLVINGMTGSIVKRFMRERRGIYIIMVELFQGKKSQDIPKRIKQRLEVIGGFDYELEK